LKEDDRIPIVKFYKGVPIHDCQPEERIKAVVEPEIDRVLGPGDDVHKLYEFARDSRNAPESRLLAHAMIEAAWEVATDERKVRPAGISLENVRAATAGLSSVQWRSPWQYCSLLDTPSGPSGTPATKREEAASTFLRRGSVRVPPPLACACAIAARCCFPMAGPGRRQPHQAAEAPARVRRLSPSRVLGKLPCNQLPGAGRGLRPSSFRTRFPP
jgi:hypothetical protein